MKHSLMEVENDQIIYIDNDTIFSEDGKFEMCPRDALIEALEMLGFFPENV